MKKEALEAFYEKSFLKVYENSHENNKTAIWRPATL